MTRAFSLTRFAPAPTGYLHLGHVLNAHHVWNLAQQSGARVLLRVEDHDRERCRPEYEAALLEDLDWLGFVPDLFPTDVFRRGACESRQSDRGDVYATVANALAARGVLYGCSCSRRELMAGSTLTPSDEIPYPGTCRDRELPLSADVSWRVRVDDSTERFDDLFLGPLAQTPSRQCGDFTIRDRRGNWTYQFVATVDDHLQGIDLVVRGHDLLSSTGRQIQLGRLIGRPLQATFAHHELLMKSPTQKLSKADGDTAVRELRARGWTREQVIAAALCGTSS